MVFIPFNIIIPTQRIDFMEDKTQRNLEFIKKKKERLQNVIAPLHLCRGTKIRTSDLHVPNVARYQLRYTPKCDAKILFYCKSAKYLLLFIEHRI